MLQIIRGFILAKKKFGGLGALKSFVLCKQMLASVRK